MGCIYLADDQRLEGRQCALKEVEHDRTLPAEMVREAASNFCARHRKGAVGSPNLPKVSISFPLPPGITWSWIMCRASLRTLMLEAKQEGRFLFEVDVLNWAGQLANALIYLHSQDPPILHRDIKPSNLKVTPRGC